MILKSFLLIVWIFIRVLFLSGVIVYYFLVVFVFRLKMVEFNLI